MPSYKGERDNLYAQGLQTRLDAALRTSHDMFQENKKLRKLNEELVKRIAAMDRIDEIKDRIVKVLSEGMGI